MTDPVTIGKFPLLQTITPPSRLTLPAHFVWLKHFTADELKGFFQELLEALQHAVQTQDWSSVTDVLETWKETANLHADPVVTEAIAQGLAELSEEPGESWAKLRAELKL